MCRCVLSQLSNFASSRSAVLISFPQRALDLQYHPKRNPDRGGCSVRDRNPPKKPQRSPREAGPRTRTTARHRHVTKTEPTSTRAAHPARNRPETAPDERGTSSSLKALINAVAVAEILTVSSLHRRRPAQQHGHGPRAELRVAQARCPHRPRSARVATQWWLSHLDQRGWPTISSARWTVKPPLDDNEAWLNTRTPTRFRAARAASSPASRATAPTTARRGSVASPPTCACAPRSAY